MKQFIEELNQPFNYQEINKPRRPYQLGDLNLNQFKKFENSYPRYSFPNLNDERFTELPLEFRQFVNQCTAFLNSNNIAYADREFIIDLDNSPVLTGQSHRDFNVWHTDASQDEKPAIIFLACDCLPTQFMINPPSLNWPAGEFKSQEDKYHLEKTLHKEATDINTISAQPNTLYLMNGYQLHRGIISERYISKRTFLRLIIGTQRRKLHYE